MDALAEACSQTDVGIYLASSEKTESGACVDDGYGYGRDDDSEDSEQGAYHELEDVNESSLELKRLVDLHGVLLAEAIDISEDDFISGDPFGRGPDREDYEGYMGNWGPDATHFYHDSVEIVLFVIRPDDQLMSTGRSSF